VWGFGERREWGPWAVGWGVAHGLNWAPICGVERSTVIRREESTGSLGSDASAAWA
jgi:hypothetical protein